MGKRRLCVGKIVNGEATIITDGGSEYMNDRPAKRVDWVTIRLVKEKSVLYGRRKISTPKDAMELVNGFLEYCDREQLVVCSLDTKNQPTAMEVVSVGTVNSSLIHPREVFKTSILSNASSVIIFHNHPSGDPTPSEEDKNITRRLKEAGQILGIEVLDHIIVADDKFCSLKEKGFL